MNPHYLKFIMKKNKNTPNKYKAHNFPNNKQFNTTPEDDQPNSRQRLG